MTRWVADVLIYEAFLHSSLYIGYHISTLHALSFSIYDIQLNADIVARGLLNVPG